MNDKFNVWIKVIIRTVNVGTIKKRLFMSRLDSFVKFLITDLEGYSAQSPCNKNKGETHRTCYGFYEKYHKSPNSMQEAMERYKTEWFTPITGVEDLDLYILQQSVNISLARSIQLVKELQRKKAESLEVVELDDLVALQLAYYKSLPSKYDEYQQGWRNRVSRTVAWLNNPLNPS